MLTKTYRAAVSIMVKGYNASEVFLNLATQPYQYFSVFQRVVIS